jgi:hypothetical protein
MADPLIVAITAATWVKVATNVTSGYIRILDHNENYLYTQRDTGGTAPSSRTEGAIFEGKSMAIGSTVAIDVYIYCQEGGSVRVDL